MHVNKILNDHDADTHVYSYFDLRVHNQLIALENLCVLYNQYTLYYLPLSIILGLLRVCNHLASSTSSSSRSRTTQNRVGKVGRSEVFCFT